MIKLYDKDRKYIKSFASYKELKITEDLETGYKTAQFQVPYIVGFLKEEQKVEIDGYLYVIKEVNMEDIECYDVYCKLDFSSLVTKAIDSLVGYGLTFPDVMNSLLAETDWTFEGNIIGAYTLDLHNQTLLEALQSVSKLYNCFLKFKTKEKIIAATPKETLVEPKTSFTLTPAKLKYCQVQSNTYDLVTRLYPIGKDLITVQNVNGNCLYLENHEYTDEVIIGYYINSHIANADDLLSVAKRKIEDIGKPRTSYKIQLSQFDIELAVGDKVRIIDSIKGINSVAFVKKVVSFPAQQEESYVELGQTLVSFDDIYKDSQEAQKVVNKDTLRNLTELNKK